MNELTQKERSIVIDLIKKEVDGLKLIKDLYNLKTMLKTNEVDEKIINLENIIEKL